MICENSKRSRPLSFGVHSGYVDRILHRTAARLCDAEQAAITNREGEAFRVSATFGQTPEYDAFLRGQSLPASRGSVIVVRLPERQRGDSAFCSLI
jgi:hypothetical protein